MKKHISRMKASKSSLKCTKTISKVEKYFNVDTFWAYKRTRVNCSIYTCLVFTLFSMKELITNWKKWFVESFGKRICIPESFNTNISHQLFWLHNNLCELTALEHKFRRWFCTQKPDFNFRFKDFWYTKINLSKKCILFPHLILTNQRDEIKREINKIYMTNKNQSKIRINKKIFFELKFVFDFKV